MNACSDDPACSVHSHNDYSILRFQACDSRHSIREFLAPRRLGFLLVVHFHVCRLLRQREIILRQCRRIDDDYCECNAHWGTRFSRFLIVDEIANLSVTLAIGVARLVWFSFFLLASWYLSFQFTQWLDKKQKGIWHVVHDRTLVVIVRTVFRTTCFCFFSIAAKILEIKSHRL